MGLVAAAAITAGIWFHSLWVGIAAGVVAFPCLGLVHAALAARFGWRRHAIGRAAAFAWQVLAATWTVLEIVGDIVSIFA